MKSSFLDAGSFPTNTSGLPNSLKYSDINIKGHKLQTITTRKMKTVRSTSETEPELNVGCGFNSEHLY